MTQALTIPTPATLAQAVEFGIGAWIHEKFGHTRSEKTRMAYTETITAFRQLLQREGFDLRWCKSFDSQIYISIDSTNHRHIECTKNPMHTALMNIFLSLWLEVRETSARPLGRV